jgi:hypothetical protein
MGARPQSDLDQLKTGVAALVACIVQTIEESDPSFRGRFEQKVSDWYHYLRENDPSPGLHALEVLNWARSAAQNVRPFSEPST